VFVVVLPIKRKATAVVFGHCRLVAPVARLMLAVSDENVNDAIMTKAEFLT
jgi:hypothetical protein